MTITLDLPPDLEARLEQEAAKHSSQIEDYTLSLIEKSLPSPDPMPELKTGADVVAFWRANGLIGDWADREDMGDSAEYARKLRRQAEMRDHS